MTNEERIKSLPRKQLAELLVKEVEQPDLDFDDDVTYYGTETFYETTDGTQFDRWCYDDAVEHECWWLAQEGLNDDGGLE